MVKEAFIKEIIVTPTTLILQAIFTLSQASSIITPRQSAYLSKKTGRKDEHSGVLCPESFSETLRNCDFSFIKHISAQQLFESSLLGKFRVSYVSKDSFFENRYGFSESCLKEQIPTVIVGKQNAVHVSQGFYKKLARSLLQRNNFTFDVQVRSFKTDRSAKAEAQRNPSLATRIKNALGFSAPESLDPKFNVDHSMGNDKFKQMLSQEEPNMTEAEKQRVKLAFAEGYLLGNNPKAGKAARYFKVVQQVLTIAIFLAIVVSLMATASGSVFR